MIETDRTPTATACRRGSGWRSRVAVVALAGALVVSSACGGDSAMPAPSRAVQLQFPAGAGVDPALRAAVATTVRQRLARVGARARVAAGPGGLTVTPAPAPGVTEALVQPGPTQIVAIDRTGLGPCPEGGPGTPTARPAARCFTLGAPITDTGAVRKATVRARAIDGWGVDVEIDPARWTAWRDALAPAAGRTVAIVANGRVLADVTLSVTALKGRIAGQLTKADAERIAAALMVNADLPVALTAPPSGATAGTTRDDVWMAALAVRVCGEWLPPAPPFMSEAGLHSHADGLIYLHSLPAEDAGRVPTLGEFADQGEWTMAKDRLRLWGDVDVRAGGKCGARDGMVVRWSVDGVERTGDPADLALAPAQHVVLEYGPAGDPLPAAPENDELLHTYWGPRV